MLAEYRAFQTIEPSSRRASRASLLALIGFVGLCLLVAAANGANIRSVQAWYQSLHQPPFAPPRQLFAPVWTLLYVSIGVSAWLVWRRVDVAAHRKRAALRRWGWQVLLNAAWPSLFFGLHSPSLGLVGIVFLLAALASTIAAFWQLHRAAALLLLPYLAWVCFAGYLNAGLWWLNRG